MQNLLIFQIDEFRRNCFRCCLSRGFLPKFSFNITDFSHLQQNRYPQLSIFLFKYFAINRNYFACQKSLIAFIFNERVLYLKRRIESERHIIFEDSLVLRTFCRLFLIVDSQSKNENFTHISHCQWWIYEFYSTLSKSLNWSDLFELIFSQYFHFFGNCIMNTMNQSCFLKYWILCLAI